MEREVEKLRNSQGKIRAGQASRTCTSRAPMSNSERTLSLSWVPRTMESSQSISRRPSTSRRTGISFILATRSRMAWSWGMKLRGQVGVDLTKGRL